MVLPIELWKQVAVFIEPNPLIYVRLASVCRKFRQVFLADTLWSALVLRPTQDQGYAAQYEASISKQDKYMIYLTWQGFAHGVDDKCTPELLFAAAVCPAVEWPREGISHPSWQNYDFVRKVLAIDGYKFFYLPYHLRLDEDLCYLALSTIPKGGPRKFGYTHPFEIVATERNVLIALEKWGTSYMSNAPESVRRDFDLMVAAAAMEPMALLYIHPSLRLNRKFIVTVVKMYGPSIEYASYDLKGDLEIAKLAVGQNGEAFKFLNDPLLDNKDLALLALKTWPEAYTSMSIRLQHDPDIVAKAIAGDPMQLANMPPHLQDERSFVLRAVKANGWALEFASFALRDDTELVMEAVSKDAGAFQFASARLREDQALIALATGRGAWWVMDYAII